MLSRRLRVTAIIAVVVVVVVYFVFHTNFVCTNSHSPSCSSQHGSPSLPASARPQSACSQSQLAEVEVCHPAWCTTSTFWSLLQNWHTSARLQIYKSASKNFMWLTQVLDATVDIHRATHTFLCVAWECIQERWFPCTARALTIKCTENREKWLVK